MNQWWTRPSGHVMMGQFGAAGELRAAEIADQKAFETALANPREANQKAKDTPGMVRDMEDFMPLADSRAGTAAQIALRAVDAALALRARARPTRSAFGPGRAAPAACMPGPDLIAGSRGADNLRARAGL